MTSASSLSAAPAKTYHGIFTGGSFYCGDDQVVGPIVTGNWNVSIDPKTPAQVMLNVFYNGSHHLAFGYNALMLVLYADGVYVFTGLWRRRDGDARHDHAAPATFFWQVELDVSCRPDHDPYNSLTFFGLASRGGG